MAKKIILLCAGGMSTSMLVKKMQEAAAADGHADWTIAAFPQADAKEQASDADCILLGPQIRFAKDKVAAACPGVPIDSIDMKIYGRMDGKGAIAIAKKLMGM
jgi:PTS system cellobiose-specific IIB component